ncbi:unnamed protein product [Meloidogyne enterolobii]|uniref:Uncharacterized protein n=1 Tax=Meloidogyne enterolobii TaxID=390850 RepID=A0ACB0ZKV6_MELEN
MQNLSQPYSFSNSSVDYLAIKNEYVDTPKPNITYGLLILLIQYTLLLPIIIICWVFMLRFLRRHGYITQVQAEELAQTMQSLPLRDIQRFTQIFHNFFTCYWFI